MLPRWSLLKPTRRPSQPPLLPSPLLGRTRGSSRITPAVGRSWRSKPWSSLPPPWSLNHIQPYTVIDDKCNENICVGCLADVEAGFEELPQMRKAAVHLQHAYEHLKFEPNKGLSIDMKAFREGPHKAECRKLDKWLIAN